MLKEKRWLVQFFLIHLCLIVPMLLASVLAVGMVTDKMKKLEDISARIRLDNVIANFEESYSTYKEESVLLSEMQELLPKVMTGDVRDTRKGIEMLQLKQYYDSRITDVFVDYGTEFLYSSKGVSRKQVHFEFLLGCRQESTDRGLAVMEGGEEAFTFLYRSDTSGYLMYSYPTRKMENGYAFINFVVSFDQIKDMLQLTDEKQWYQLQTSDGSVLSVGCDDSGKAFVLSANNREERLNSGKYVVTQNEIAPLGMTICLYSEKFSLNQENGLYQMQLINMELIVAGALLSAVTSWILSKRRMNEIMRLEEIARGDIAYRFSQKNVYNRLQDIIVTGLSESKEREVQLRDQTAYLIFQGKIDNFENINDAFQKLGYAGCPRRFFVGAVSTATRLKSS